MGLFGKLAFWKKEDSLGSLGSGLDSGTGLDASFSNPSPPQGMNPAPPTQGYGQDPGFGQQGFGQPGFGQPPQEQEFGFSPQGPPSFRQQPSVPQPAQSDYIVSKEIELVSSKLDSLRSSIETLNARISNIERMMENEQRRRW